MTTINRRNFLFGASAAAISAALPAPTEAQQVSEATWRYIEAGVVKRYVVTWTGNCLEIEWEEVNRAA